MNNICTTVVHFGNYYTDQHQDLHETQQIQLHISLVEVYHSGTHDLKNDNTK
jgi:hypothetical protein